MRIAFLSIGSPLDRATWSGVPFYALRELKRRFPDVHVVDTPNIDYLIQRSSFLRRVGLSPSREPLVLSVLSKIVGGKLRAIKPDAVIAINAVHKIVDIKEKYPMIYCSDGFFGNIIQYYPQYSSLSDRTRRNGDRQQRRLLSRGASVLLSSHWSARTAAEYYEQPQSRFKVAPLGANFETEPEAGEIRANAGPLKLLFVGYDWTRKGGEVVLEAFKILRQRLGAVELHIVGCTPPETQGVDGVVLHGRLDKADAGEARKIEDLFRDSSFFFMPSRQEAFGLAFCEACAFGLPPVAADTGGVGTIVQHGVNGLLLPMDAPPAAYAEAIEQVWSDEAAYRAMQAAARDAYDRRLNWRAWGDLVEQELRQLTAAR